MISSAFSIAIVAMFEEDGTSINLNVDEKHEVLGIYFLGYMITKIPSGRLADTFGARKVVGFSTILAALLTLATPFIVQWDYYALLGTRLMTGVLEGCIFPCLLPITANWYSTTPSSKFLSSMEASAFGIGFTFLIGGYLIDVCGWASIFYFVGSVTLIWVGVWFYLVYDSPNEHPRITPDERIQIGREIANFEIKKYSLFEIPWKGILTSGPVWAIVIAQVANFYLYAILTNEVPTYLSEVFQYDIAEVGLFASLPPLGKYFVTILFGNLADYSLSSGKLSVGATRKIFEALGLLVPAGCLAIQAIFGHSLAVSLLTLMSAKLFNGAIVGGHLPSIVEVAPNFSGFVSGWVFTFAAIAAYSSAKITALLLQNGHTFDEWKYTFWITAGICLIGFVWAIVIAQVANFYLYAILTNEVPTYLSEVLQYDIAEVGLFASLPPLGKYFVTILFGNLADYSLSSGKLSVGATRKIFEALGLLVPAGCLAIQAIFGHSLAVSLLTLMSAKLFNGAIVGGHLPSIVEVAPNFSGFVSGWVFTFAAIAAYSSAKITALLLQNGHTFDEWKYTFWITAGICLIGFVWAIVIAQVANFYLYAILTNEVPTYLSEVLQYDIAEVGLFASLPPLGKYFVTILFGNLADYSLNSGKLLVGTTRKIFEALGLLVPAGCLAIQAIFGHSLAVSLLTLMSAKLFNGAIVGGHLPSIVEVAPNFSGFVSGNAMPPIHEMLTCRRILTIMSVSGFIVNAVLKTVFNIAVVAMTKKTNQTAEIFAWDENQRQELIGIFFWGFALTKIPSGRLAEVIGSRKVTGYSMLLASLLTILTPWISYSNYYILLSSRVLMGFLVGASWPAVMPLAARWVPPHEQTIFISCIASTAVGAGIAFQVSGFLISALGWKSVFYVFGGVSTLWSLLWFGLIYDSPQQHPRISQEEKDLIESQIRDVKIRNVRLSEIPWISILTSGPVWAIAAGQIAVFFGYMTLSNEIPSYMDQVLHLEIKQIGIFAGFPYFGAYFLSLASSHFADYLRKSGKLSTTAVRKIFEAVGLLVPAFSMLLLVFWGYLTPVAVTLFTISITTCAISSAGHCTNMLDVSPNFAGTICGLVNTFSSFTAYISTEMVTALLRKDNTFKEWRFVFAIVFGVEVIATGVYLIFCSGEKQSWDSVKTNEGREEIRPLKRKNLNQNLE
ncbi:hypothetical protein TcasGA2_TC008412 [Tribolium castaneum]|uniref:Major facilitator superfamily (MFS) profile domain-containing protein n=1 Tax=Tribolium castaneum TaxID=7070 RepID=D2A1M2_TRICA|nr:hypothetical protein TcasGA2_TC008412 [Tribolium castaneum]